MPPLIYTMYVLLFKCYGDIQQMEESKIKFNTELIKKAHEKEEIRVIVKYKKKDKLLSYKELQIKDNLIQKEEVVKKHGGTIIKHLPLINGAIVIVKRKDIKEIEEDIDVEYVEIDQPVYAFDNISQEDVIPLSEEITWAVERVNAHNYHQITKGEGIKVAIIDSGVYVEHPDLINNIKGGYDFIRDSETIYDDCNHGTCVAGIIAAENNDIGILGIAPEASIYSLRVLKKSSSGGCYGYSSIIAEAIEWSIENNMDIINMSIGGRSYSYTVEHAVNNAYEAGILIIASAGNYGKDCNDNDCVAYPAALDNVIAIAATMRTNDKIADFSSRGTEVELAAPGYYVVSTASNGGYRGFYGTSAASPVVAGVATLLTAAYPEKINVEIREKLIEIADDLGQEGRDIVYGHGIPVLSLDIEEPCVPNWQCDIPLNGYESDGCGNRRYNTACEPETEFEIIQSPHNYDDYYDNTWVIYNENTIQGRIHFSRLETEPDFDYVIIYDKYDNEIIRYDGINNDIWTPWIDGDTIKVRLISDKCITAFGFIIDKQEVIYNELSQIEIGIIEAPLQTYPGIVNNVQITTTLENILLSDVLIELSVTNGELSKYSGMTDSSGRFFFNFIASNVYEQTNAVITINAFKEGYITGTTNINILINPSAGYTLPIESPHPYPKGYNNTWIVTEPGASIIRAHILKIIMSYPDALLLYDKYDNMIYKRSGSVFQSFWSPWITGDTMKIVFDGANGGIYGFTIDDIEIA